MALRASLLAAEKLSSPSSASTNFGGKIPRDKSLFWSPQSRCSINGRSACKRTLVYPLNPLLAFPVRKNGGSHGLSTSWSSIADENLFANWLRRDRRS